MTDEHPQPVGTALAQAARANDIVVIADPDHLDMNIPKAIAEQLPAMQRAGVKHLYLEHDPHDVSMQELRTNDTEYGAMVRKAESLGITVHEYDDRSAARVVAAQFPEEAKFMHEHDMYGVDPDALIKESPNPERMRAFLDAKQAQLDDIGPRNDKIVANIGTDMDRHPDEKAVVMIGEAHTLQRQDVDEGLRTRGYRTTTVEVNSAQSNLDAGNATAPDHPDIVVAAETGNAVSYKDPKTEKMHRVMEGVELPWKNTEAISDHPASAAPERGNLPPVPSGPARGRQ